LTKAAFCFIIFENYSQFGVNMAEYNTEQKKLLLEFLEENHDSAYTIEEITSELKSRGASVGKSTVYRLMTKLVEEKRVKRQLSDSSRKAIYRITLDAHCHNHLHLQCTKCGKVLHLDETVSDKLLDTVKRLNDFSVSEEDTVLMGKCAECKLGGSK
jgi:Fur family ferric uptake transcriptional regulator